MALTGSHDKLAASPASTSPESPLLRGLLLLIGVDQFVLCLLNQISGAVLHKLTVTHP